MDIFVLTKGMISPKRYFSETVKRITEILFEDRKFDLTINGRVYDIVSEDVKKIQIINVCRFDNVTDLLLNFDLEYVMAAIISPGVPFILPHAKNCWEKKLMDTRPLLEVTKKRYNKACLKGFDFQGDVKLVNKKWVKTCFRENKEETYLEEEKCAYLEEETHPKKELCF